MGILMPLHRQYEPDEVHVEVHQSEMLFKSDTFKSAIFNVSLI